jgi:chromosomal replication initiator protein
MAFAASLAVAEAPGKTTYNPLFLYGGVGLGKTHLMHSIGNYILHNDPESKVLYTSAENLMNEFISSLLERKNQEFRDKYRKIDVLLVDDIQFLSDKEGTQEEFFHTFNALYNDNKQIVISSDKPPIELKTLEERLRSRFGCGLIVDITLPDFETRTAILQKKSEIDNINVPKDVIRHIAKNISSNIRELEGALIKVTAYGKLTNTPISIELAERALKDMVNENDNREVTVEFIQTVVANHFGIAVDELKSKKRTQNITFARHLAMYLVRMLMDLALLKVGKEFGGRDHTTVIHACNKVNEELENNPGFKETLIELEKKIKGE